MHRLLTLTGSAWRRALFATFVAATVLLGTALPVAAYDPIDLFEHEPTPPPAPRATRHRDARTVTWPLAPTLTRPRPSTPPPRGDEPTDPIGYDVSWPQCNDSLPDSFAFAVVGVNRGRPFSQNECLETQLLWAGPDADFYMNTANPGPDHSSFWPTGAAVPRACEVGVEDTHDCAYVYGWDAAAHGYDTVLDMYVKLGWADAAARRVPGEATWWLDVETANSWRGDRALNVAALQGAVDYLESRGVSEVGFYSTPLLWWRVTSSTDVFEGYPAWHAGATNVTDAENRCDHPAFTGGELRMVQWIENGLDRNLRC